MSLRHSPIPYTFVILTMLSSVGICDLWDGGTGDFTDSNWDGGMPHPGAIVSDSNIELDGETVQIFSGTVNSNMMRIRTVGGSFEVADAELNVTSTSDLAGLDLGSLSAITGATTASFTNSNVSVEGSGTSGRSFFVRNGSTLTINGGTLTILHSNETSPARAVLEIETEGVVTMTGDAVLETQVLRIDQDMAGFNFESGSVILNNNHPLRGAVTFNGQFNFTGAAGAATITHNDLTDKNVVRHLAGRVTNRFFSIDGVVIETTVIYDGTNIADINSELATLAVGGRALQLEEVDGVQTLAIVEAGGSVLKGDVNLDGVVDLLDVGPFVTQLTSGGSQAEADVNCDGLVDLLDVVPFVDILTGG